MTPIMIIIKLKAVLVMFAGPHSDKTCCTTTRRPHCIPEYQCNDNTPELDMLEQLKLDTHLVADWPHVNYYSVKFEL